MSRSPEECQRWVQRVHEAQLKRTPEQMEAARQRMELSRRLTCAEKKVKSARSHVVRGQGLAFEGLRQMAACSAPQDYTMVQERWSSAMKASDSRQMERLQRIDFASSAAAAAAPAVVVTAAEEEAEEEEALMEVAQLAGVDDVRTMAAVAAADVAIANVSPGMSPASAGPEGSSLDALLEQLRVEPKDETEMAAKFMLYSGYSEEVSKMRGTLCSFWEESRDAVPPAVATDMGRTIKGIDAEQNLGFADDLREWFVYHMMRQAAQNNRGMAKILEDFQRKLELLAANAQSECPICLEQFQEDGAHVAETLGCCHKVCKECWEHWCVVTHNQPFCPLCRHDEFLGRVAASVASV